MKSKAKQRKTGIVTLCDSSGCCPTVDFTQQDVVVIRDDFGGRVMLSLKEWIELTQTKREEHL